MSTTPQMSHLGQQQGQQYPSTSPYQQYQQQPFGQQQGFAQQPFGQQQGSAQQPFGMQQPMGMGGSLEQLQQLGQQQPYQQLLHQLGQQQPTAQQQQVEQQLQQQLHQVVQVAVQQAQQQVQAQAAALAAGIADGYIDVVQPLPGQPSLIALRIINAGFKVFPNPNAQTHDQVQEAFAFGHQVIGIWDQSSPTVLRSIQIRRI
jgi:hypothetical protein